MSLHRKKKTSTFSSHNEPQSNQIRFYRFLDYLFGLLIERILVFKRNITHNIVDKLSSFCQSISLFYLNLRNLSEKSKFWYFGIFFQNFRNKRSLCFFQGKLLYVHNKADLTFNFSDLPWLRILYLCFE